MELRAVAVEKHFPAGLGLAAGRGRAAIRALDGVSVDVAEGETLGIVGESGSGKTTLARLFLNLDRPTAGAILFDGRDVASFGREDLARYRRAVQAVFQDPYSSLNPRMRVEHIVSEPLPPGELSRADTRAPRGRACPRGSARRAAACTRTSSAAASASASPSPARS